jgi:hypothetical protein
LRASAPGADPIVSGLFDIDVASGSVTDPVDAAEGAPDLVSSTMTVNQGNLYISVRYAAGTFSIDETMINVVLDTDENPATGSPGVDSGCVNDAATMGLEYIINSGGYNGDNIVVYKHAGGTACNSWNAPSTVGTRTVVMAGEFPVGVDMVVPLSALGGDSGRLKFKVNAATIIPDVCPGCSTGVQDYMPNVGTAPGVIPDPIILFMH